MTTPVQVRVDLETKQNAVKLFSSLGLDMSSAINIFLHQCLMKGGLPFEVYNPKYNKETVKAIKDGIKLSKSGKAKRYSSVKDLMNDLNK